jgi:hypothetical protein
MFGRVGTLPMDGRTGGFFHLGQPHTSHTDGDETTNLSVMLAIHTHRHLASKRG